jgi:hypothetical protein
MFAGWDLGGLWSLGILVPLALVVLWYGTKQIKRQWDTKALRPRGRPYHEGGGSRRGNAAWLEQVRALEAHRPTGLAEARQGPVRLQATIVGASGNLGGAPGHECVWRNRAGARTDAAVGADVVFVADDTGRGAVENLESARVVAPTESHGHHWESVSLYIGDRVELFGRFDPERVGEDPDPTKLVYGTLGASGPLLVRLLERPSDPSPTPDADTDTAPDDHHDEP